jgi:hypothetical protein
MRGRELQSNNGAGSGKQTLSEVVLTFLFIGMVTLALMVAATIYEPIQRHSVQWLLAFGATAYGLTLGATVVAIAMRRLLQRLLVLRLVIGCLVFALVLGPLLVGSVAIAQAIVQLTGNRWENSDAMLGLILWGATALLLLLLLRRTIPTQR